MTDDLFPDTSTQPPPLIAARAAYDRAVDELAELGQNDGSGTYERAQQRLNAAGAVLARLERAALQKSAEQEAQ